MANGKNILLRFKRRWLLLLYLEAVLYALGGTLLFYSIFQHPLPSLILFLLLFALIILIKSPWKLDLKAITAYVDNNLKEAEYSSGLLLMPADEITGLAQLQQQRTEQRLGPLMSRLSPDHNLRRAFGIFGILILLGFGSYYFGISSLLGNDKKVVDKKETIIFEPIDPIVDSGTPPKIIGQELEVKYPSYTGLATLRTSNMDIKAVWGSRVSWSLRFDAPVTSVYMESMGQRFPMALEKDTYTFTTDLNAPGFYNFQFTDTLENSYLSPLYAIEVVPDMAPVIGMDGLDQFTSFDWNDKKEVQLRALVSDDFGIGDAYIIGTVSKGTGESVKFREEKIIFDGVLKKGAKRMELFKKIDLDTMGMGTGDELYFYVEAVDLKSPTPNTARSETYFAVIKDTVTDEFAVEGTMGVDQMPDYFRSQRQLIIDTEKLISDRNKISKKDFNFRSNELGFDQKALRLKYGEFMGDESEMEGPEPGPMEGEGTEGHDANPLAEYTHDHDGANEHNLVEQEKENASEGEGETDDPLHDYLHNHDDPEESTLFTQSLKSKLRQALNEMWDAELHLRVYHPEQSLPYQYRALKLIQDIKNSARIYVHRIGFDPPPIKEDKRLTGKLDAVSNFTKKEDLKLPLQYPMMRKALVRLEELVADGGLLTEVDVTLFGQAGGELAIKAIEEPGNHLTTLQQLNTLRSVRQVPKGILLEVQQGLYRAIPGPRTNPTAVPAFESDINKLLIQELEVHER
tara:strand:+ start:83505 stop:85730 length:2226 start_codon:yes stop_codon:yes gene_type:complete